LDLSTSVVAHCSLIYQVFDGKELQQIFKLKELPLSEAAVEKVPTPDSVIFRCAVFSRFQVFAAGMHFALLKGVDPVANNFVAVRLASLFFPFFCVLTYCFRLQAAWFATKGGQAQIDAASVLMRLEARGVAWDQTVSTIIMHFFW